MRNIASNPWHLLSSPFIKQLPDTFANRNDPRRQRRQWVEPCAALPRKWPFSA